MHGGLSSELIDFVDDTIVLEINISESCTKDNLTTAIQLALSWKNNNHQLFSAKRFKVYIINSKKISGFSIPANQPNLMESIKGLADRIKANADLKEEVSEIIEGYF